MIACRASPARRRAGLAGGAVAMLLAAACSTTAAPGDRGVITIGNRTAPNSLDPRLANDEATARIAQLVFTSLMDLGPDLRPAPRLARRLDNPDPLTYVAHLRHGVLFHDGHELTARDVVYTFGAFLDPKFISPYKGAYRVLRSVRAVDDYTVEFTLREPFAAFPVQLTTPPVVPAGAGDALTRFPIGTGPYRFVRYDVDDQVVLAAFEDYFDGPANNAGVVFKIVPDDTMRGLALRKGTLDLVINDLPPDIVYQLERSGGFRVERSPGLDFSYLGFNLRDPTVADKRVRHAIGYAIDRDGIVRHLRRGLARPAVGLIPSQAWAFEPAVHEFSYDPARARRLLDQAGHPDPDGDGPQPRLRITLTISTNDETRLQATVIQDNLKKVGIELELKSYEFATFFADVLSGNFQVFSLQWVGGALVDPDILRRVFHSEQVPPAGFNRGFYSSPEVDRLIDLSRVARSEAERKEYYSAVQKIIAEDAPYIPIWNRTNVMVSQRSLDGLHVSPTGDFLALKDVRRVPPVAP